MYERSSLSQFPLLARERTKVVEAEESDAYLLLSLKREKGLSHQELERERYCRAEDRRGRRVLISAA